LAPVVAAGGLGITLLAGPVFVGAHRDGLWEVTASVVGLVGAAVLVVAVAYLLRSRPMAFSVDAVAALDAAREAEVLDDAAEFDEAMARALAERRARNAPIVERLHVAFTVALIRLLAELGGTPPSAQRRRECAASPRAGLPTRRPRHRPPDDRADRLLGSRQDQQFARPRRGRVKQFPREDARARVGDKTAAVSNWEPWLLWIVIAWTVSTALRRGG
jgi:hypothetical protein